MAAVYEDLPENSSFHDLSFIAPWSVYAGMPENKDAKGDWNHNSFQLFAQVADGRKMDDVSAMIKDVKLRALGNGAAQTYTIVGVVRDIVMASPYEPVKPAVYHLSPLGGYLNFRINPVVSMGEAIDKIEAVCKKYSPAAPFDYKFADEEYGRKFANEQRIGNLATVLAILAIFISCTGLFGLASFIAEQRTREIGIRKVLGASVLSLWQLQSKEFLLLVMISLLIAIPGAWLFMHSWLENYPYRVALTWWVFAGTGVGAIGIALMTVSFQSIKAALLNPSISLRSEG